MWRHNLWQQISSSPFLRRAFFLSWSVLAGLAFGYSIPPKLFPGIEWIGFVPFLTILLFPIERGRVLFFYGWVAFTTATGIYTSWIFNAFPLTWMQISDFWVGISLTSFAWLTVIIIPGLAGGFLLLALRAVLRNDAFDILRIAFLVAAVDFLRTFFAAWHPFLWGTGSILGDNWATNILGYAIADYATLRQLASVGGFYALSFVAALPSALIFFWIRSLLNAGSPALTPTLVRRGIAASIGVSMLLGVLLIGGQVLAGAFYEPGASLRVAIISAPFTPEDWQVEKFQARSSALFSQLIKTASTGGADIILLPEGSALSSSTLPNLADYRPIIKSLMPGERPAFLINLFPTGQEPYAYGRERPATNNIHVFDSTGEVFGVYSKQFLMPFGEYMPFLYDRLGRALGFTPWFDQHAPNWRIPGNHTGTFRTPFGSIGVLGCSEIISPYVSRRTVRDGAEVLLYTASIGILRGSERLHAQNLTIAQIRAAETRRSLAYAANGGHSFFVDPQGTILWENPVIAPGVKIVEARTNSALTPAVKYENWFSLSAITLLLIDGVKNRIRRRR